MFHMKAKDGKRFFLLSDWGEGRYSVVKRAGCFFLSNFRAECCFRARKIFLFVQRPPRHNRGFGQRLSFL